jgi:hypothetical protein
MGRRLVIDTDIGTDVDDLWTLAMLPGLAGLDLEAVTLVYGDTDVRARLAATALAMMGIHVPVYRGCEQPLSGKAVMWAGHEGVGVPGLAEAAYAAADAVDVLIDLASADPGSLEVLAMSHVGRAELHDGVLRFIFERIMLPDSTSDPLGSQGFVRFTVRHRPALPEATEVHNHAAIYFDLNPPIITNTVLVINLKYTWSCASTSTSTS